MALWSLFSYNSVFVLNFEISNGTHKNENCHREKRILIMYSVNTV